MSNTSPPSAEQLFAHVLAQRFDATACAAVRRLEELDRVRAALCERGGGAAGDVRAEAQAWAREVQDLVGKLELRGCVPRFEALLGDLAAAAVGARVLGSTPLSAEITIVMVRFARLSAWVALAVDVGEIADLSLMAEAGVARIGDPQDHAAARAALRRVGLSPARAGRSRRSRRGRRGGRGK